MLPHASECKLSAWGSQQSAEQMQSKSQLLSGMRLRRSHRFWLSDGGETAKTGSGYLKLQSHQSRGGCPQALGRRVHHSAQGGALRLERRPNEGGELRDVRRRRRKRMRSKKALSRRECQDFPPHCLPCHWMSLGEGFNRGRRQACCLQTPTASSSPIFLHNLIGICDSQYCIYLRLCYIFFALRPHSPGFVTTALDAPGVQDRRRLRL